MCSRPPTDSPNLAGPLWLCGVHSRPRIRQFRTFKLRGLAAEGDIKGVQRGHKEDISDSPNKEEDLNLNPDQNQNCAVAGFDMAVDSEVQSNENKVQIVSSSSSETADDDTKLPSQSLIDRILQAFEQSPITTGKVKITDRITARELFSRFTSDEIEYGIVLAGARRTTSLLCGNDSCRAKVQTLAYFSNAIQEATEDPNMSASYLQYLRHSLRRNVEMMAHLEEDAQMYGKKRTAAGGRMKNLTNRCKRSNCTFNTWRERLCSYTGAQFRMGLRLPTKDT